MDVKVFGFWKKLMIVMGVNLAITIVAYFPDFFRAHIMTHLGGPMTITGLELGFAMPLLNLAMAIFYWITAGPEQNMKLWGKVWGLGALIMLLLSFPSCIAMTILEQGLPGATYQGF